jgi:glycosyltransferase involved in cell wall biosynthesis
MRVTLVSYDDAPPLGGQGVLVQGMRDALTRHGLDVATVAGRGAHAVRYPRVTGRAPLDLSFALNRRPSLITRTDPDVVHAHGGPGGVLLLRRLNAPLVYTAHHTYRQAHRRSSVRRALAPLEARAYRRAAMLLPVSRSTADALLSMGIPASRIEVLPPGIDVSNSLDVSRDRARILFVGRMEAHKGVWDAVDVMRDVIRARADATAALVGAGPLAGAVRRRVAGEPRIEFRGRVDAATLRREYARAAVVVVPSRYEGLGLVALEAQAAATPVAGYDVDGLRNAAGEGGVLVPSGDVGALTAAVMELLARDGRRAELGRRGREFVRRTHSWDAVAGRLEEIYRRLTA